MYLVYVNNDIWTVLVCIYMIYAMIRAVCILLNVCVVRLRFICYDIYNIYTCIHMQGIECEIDNNIHKRVLIE